MADTYVGILSKYIIPGANKDDRPSAPGEEKPSDLTTQKNIKAVEGFAREAQKKIGNLAGKVTRECLEWMQRLILSSAQAGSS